MNNEEAKLELQQEQLDIPVVIQRSEQSSKIIDGECMLCGDVADTKDGWICEDCRKFQMIVYNVLQLPEGRDFNHKK